MDAAADQTIRRMDDVLASQVAAGEVVERPASVIKELVENSIDAGAKAIRVEIHRGGIARMKVSDNGRGMSRADLALCLQRHATSKLTSFEDLFNINQMGFRGEALPSIASVAHVRITTRRATDVEGSLLECHGGAEEPICATGCPPGTEIEVQELFYNTPVRRKFLKSVETEAGHIEHQLKLHALAFPEVRFTFVKDGQQVFDAPATHDLRQRIAEFAGRETAERLLRIRPTAATGVQISGFLMPLTEARRNKRQQYVFLNGRPIEDKIVARAVRDGYGGFPTGLHPGIFLYLTVEPALVDVNVHPAKREVRFRRPADVTLAIIDAISSTLADHARGDTPPPYPAPAPLPEPAWPEPAAPHTPAPQPAARQAATPRRELPTQRRETPAPQPHTPRHEEPRPLRAGLRLELPPRQQPLPLEEPEPRPPMPSPREPRFRYMGIVHEQYALFENPEGMALVSVRAARERIIFERLMQLHERPMYSQKLLIPALVELDAREMGIAQELQPLLAQAGFTITAFGKHTLRVESVPSILSSSRMEDFITGLITTYSTGETRLKRDKNPFRPFAMLLARQQVQQEDMRMWLQNAPQLLDDLLSCENPYCTARGKPTMIPYPLSEIQRKFQAL